MTVNEQHPLSGLEAIIDEATGANDHSLSRLRPFDGQPHTDSGVRGSQQVSGVTMRDIRDCYVRAVCLSAGHVAPLLYEEALRGEAGAICDNDLYSINLQQLDPVAIAQNLGCEIERVMGIYPNVPTLTALFDEPQA